MLFHKKNADYLTSTTSAAEIGVVFDVSNALVATMTGRFETIIKTKIKVSLFHNNKEEIPRKPRASDAFCSVPRDMPRFCIQFAKLAIECQRYRLVECVLIVLKGKNRNVSAEKI